MSTFWTARFFTNVIVWGCFKIKQFMAFVFTKNNYWSFWFYVLNLWVIIFIFMYFICKFNKIFFFLFNKAFTTTSFRIFFFWKKTIRSYLKYSMFVAFDLYRWWIIKIFNKLIRIIFINWLNLKRSRRINFILL
jgi:hypothetical protein